MRRGARGRVAIAGVLCATAATMLVGCVGQETDDYCAAVEKSREQLVELTSAERAPDLATYLPLLSELGERAPSDLADEWQTFLAAVTGLVDALEQAGVDTEDFVDGEPPPGLSALQANRITAAARELSAEPVVSATQGIEQQARDVCKINLGT